LICQNEQLKPCCTV